MFIGFIAIEVTGDPISASFEGSRVKWLKILLESRMKEASSTDCLLSSLAINGEVRKNELIQDMDAGLRKIFF